MRETKTGIRKLCAVTLLCFVLSACSTNGAVHTPAGNNSAEPGEQASAADKEQAVVTLSVMTKDRYLEEAEQQFESANPHIDIQIEETAPADNSGGMQMIRKGDSSADNGPTSEQIDKYVQTVNTAIMSGNAADIVAVEHLPLDAYIEKGLLTDWNTVADADADFAKADYYENIIDGVTKGDGWYGIPISFSLDVMVGDASLLEQNGLDDATWTWDQFVELLEQQRQSGSSQYGLSGVKPEDLLAYLVESVYDQLVKQNGGTRTFDADAFLAYLEQVNYMYEQELVTEAAMGPGSASFRMVNMQTPIEAAMVPKAGGQEQAGMLRPPGAGQDEGIPFKSNQVLALNAQSQVKEEAWEFVKFLLSEEMLSSKSMMGFALHKDALATKLKEMQEMLAQGGRSGSGQGLVVKGPDGSSMQLTDEDIEQILAVIPYVGKYENSDAQVLQMIRTEAAAYFSGSKSAEAVADLLANRITTYLNE